MKIEQTFPWKERDEYSISAWLNDLLNIIKKRMFLLDKNTALMVFLENADEFLSCYCDGLSPMEAYEEFNE